MSKEQILLTIITSGLVSFFYQIFKDYLQKKKDDKALEMFGNIHNTFSPRAGYDGVGFTEHTTTVFSQLMKDNKKRPILYQLIKDGLIKPPTAR